MYKTITLRLPEDHYERFRRYADADNRPISNLIETAALRYLDEHPLVSTKEMDEIHRDTTLVEKLKKGSLAAKTRRGRFAE